MLAWQKVQGLTLRRLEFGLIDHAVPLAHRTRTRVACLERHAATSRAIPLRASCSRWSAITTRRFACREAGSLRDGEGLPRFVEREFREFLTCGCLAAGFARFHCDACGHDRLVPFSCKGRGFCPSCGGRRMAERAAHLVEHVLPDVPMRQWVLSLPHRLRYLLAWDHDLCRAVAGVSPGGPRVPAGAKPARRRVRRAQRSGRDDSTVRGRLNLNVHLHALVIDGVFAHAGEGLAFTRLAA